MANKFYLTIDASAMYSVDAPTLQVLVGGVVVSSAVVTAQTGSSSNTLSFLLEFPDMDSFPSSLGLRFTDASGEAGRDILLEEVRVNGQVVDAGNLSLISLNQNDLSSVSTGAIDHLFARVNPTAGDLGTVTLAGGSSDDVLNGAGGNDVIDGGNGADRIRGVGDDDAINGGAGADLIYGEDGNDIVLGGAGDDTIYGGAGDDLLYGQSNNDSLMGGNGNDILNGGAGDDMLMGNGGDDILFGEDGNDLLVGAAGNDTMYGDAGDDTLAGGAGNDTMYGGLGIDALVGGAGADVIYGGGDDDFIYGDAGNDTLSGDAGADLIYGGNNNDTLNGGSENDSLHGDAGADTLNGDAGNDMLNGGASADTLNGGTGIDVLHGHGLDAMAVSSILRDNAGVMYSEETGSFYQLVSTAVNYNTASSAATGTTLNGVAGHLVTINSATENSIIDTLANNNEVWLGASDSGTEGAWLWHGGAESGLQFWSGAAAGSATGNMYTNWASGEPNDYNTGEDHVVMRGDGLWNDLVGTSTRYYVIEWDAGMFSDDNATDTLNGGDDADILYGYGGDDVLSGDAGNDALYGGAGNDTLHGGQGDDALHGGEGNDVMNGGDGNDTLVSSSIGDTGSWIQSILNDYPNVTYNSTTGNFYQVVTSTQTWTDARAAAAANQIDGVSGHLATLTSQAEHDFASDLANGVNTWLGGSDDPTITGGAYDQWYWVEGPEAGTLFSNDGTAAGGQFATWSPGQPNDTNDTQNYLYILDDGLWADIVVQGDGSTGFVTVPQYLIEWEGSDLMPESSAITSAILNGDDGNDTLYGGSGADVLNGGSGNDTLYSGSVGTAVDLITTQTFASNNGVFTYDDNLFGGNAGWYASGTRTTTDGDGGNGALQVLLGGINNNSASNISGGWQATVTADEDISGVQLTFSYKMILASQTENGEDAMLYVEINDVKYGISPNDYVHRLDGVNGGGSDDNTGWQQATINVGSLSAGDHTLEIGGYMTSKNSSSEDVIFRLDNVAMSGRTGDATALNGGTGLDTLVGDDGMDIFAFDNMSNVDIIQGFNLSHGDALDISDILLNYDPNTSAITDYVQITTVGGDSQVRVDANGTTGGSNFVQIATITGVTSLTDEAALLNSGNIIVA